MDLNRRKFLQAAGATASTTAVAGPTGLATTVGARETALTAGNGPYLVVGNGEVLDLCGNYHDAVHQASVLRHGTGGSVRHVRCTQTLMQQLKTDPRAVWLDVDGLAVTPSEAETRGFEFLRRARNGKRARQLLWNHHLEALRETIDSDDMSDPETCWYVTRDSEVIDVVREQDGQDDSGETYPSQHIHPCTSALADALKAHLNDGKAVPVINTSTARHMCEHEFLQRMEADLPFRIAVTRPQEKRVPASELDRTQSMTLMVFGNWLFAPYVTQLPDETERVNAHDVVVDGHLARVIEENGFVMPGFWREVKGVLHHVDAFADNVPAPKLSGRTIRHQNRHT